MPHYLDHAATTPLDERVLEAMLPWLREGFGNPSSLHAAGRRARHAVEDARNRMAALIRAEPGEIVFVSGGTEADNVAVAYGAPRGLVTSSAEHEAVLEPARRALDAGADVRILAPAAHGAVTPGQLRAALAERSAGLVSLMHTNNETGARTDLPAVAAVCREHGARLHTDAVQAGLDALDVNALGVDLMTLSGHKVYGPKGAGVLYVRAGVDVEPVVAGGSQERGRRAGTENVPAILGMVRAFELAAAERDARRAHVAALRDRLRRGLREHLGDAVAFNTPDDAAPHIENIAFRPSGSGPVDGEMLLLSLDLEGIQVSSGSACTSGALKPSHVLLALGLDRATASAALRFSLGKGTTEADVDAALDALVRVARRMALPIPA